MLSFVSNLPVITQADGGLSRKATHSFQGNSLSSFQTTASCRLSTGQNVVIIAMSKQRKPSSSHRPHLSVPRSSREDISVDSSADVSSQLSQMFETIGTMESLTEHVEKAVREDVDQFVVSKDRSSPQYEQLISELSGTRQSSSTKIEEILDSMYPGPDDFVDELAQEAESDDDMFDVNDTSGALGDATSNIDFKPRKKKPMSKIAEEIFEIMRPKSDDRIAELMQAEMDGELLDSRPMHRENRSKTKRDKKAEQLESYEEPVSDAKKVKTSNMPGSDPGLQCNPRKVDAKDMEQRIKNLKQRKRRLAIERGVDESIAFRKTLPPPSGILDALAYLGEGVDMDSVEDVSSFSLARAWVVDFATAASLPRSSALTTHAEFLIHQVMRVPFTYKPFFGLQGAFQIFYSPPCPRCKSPVFNDVLTDEVSICQDCFTEIYLEDGSLPFAYSSGEPAWDAETRAERKAEQEMIIADALAVSTSLLENQQTAGRSVVKMADASTQDAGPAVKRSGGSTMDKVGEMNNPSNGSGSNDNNVKEPPTRGASRIGDDWNVRASDRSLRTINPIRNLVQNIDVKPNPDKKIIRLSVGDPTVYGNLKVSPAALSRFVEVINSGKANGYSMSMGGVEARKAVAERYSTRNSPLTADDVVLTAGTSGALEVAIGAIANEGDNVLLPQPGFPLFRTISEGYGIECRYYRVNPDKNWEIELQDLMELADTRTAAIVVNNPSNPCGSVYSESHIEDLLAMASLLKLPIIADEVYADMVFSAQSFTPMSSKASDVPVLSVGGISKQCVVPGWRLGWILIHDPNDVLEAGEVRKGIRQLTTRMLVPNTPVQMLLPMLLQKGTRDQAFRAVMQQLESNADFTVKALSQTKGIRCITPQGAMYVMVAVDVKKLGFADDMEFTKKLLEEEAVFVLPGQCFQAPNFVRIVFSAPKEVLAEAFDRVKAFCGRHSQET